jgi:hypothetical protein
LFVGLVFIFNLGLFESGRVRSGGNLSSFIGITLTFRTLSVLYPYFILTLFLLYSYYILIVFLLYFYLICTFLLLDCCHILI